MLRYWFTHCSGRQVEPSRLAPFSRCFRRVSRCRRAQGNDAAIRAAAGTTTISLTKISTKTLRSVRSPSVGTSFISWA